MPLARATDDDRFGQIVWEGETEARWKTFASFLSRQEQARDAVCHEHALRLERIERPQNWPLLHITIAQTVLELKTIPVAASRASWEHCTWSEFLHSAPVRHSLETVFAPKINQSHPSLCTPKLIICRRISPNIWTASSQVLDLRWFFRCRSISHVTDSEPAYSVNLTQGESGHWREWKIKLRIHVIVEASESESSWTMCSRFWLLNRISKYPRWRVKISEPKLINWKWLLLAIVLSGGT